MTKYIVNNEGTKGLYAGFYTNMLRTLPATFITLYVYEKVVFYLKAAN